MKRCPQVPQRSHIHRRGALFHYYMMYLFLTSILLTLAGTCIHTILKADRVDSEVAMYLHTLLRMEGELRQDAGRATEVSCDDTTITLSTANDPAVVRWSLNDNVAKRESFVDESVVTSDRFVFRRGTRLQCATREQQWILTVHEPSATPVDSGDPEATSSAKSVQILLVVSSVDKLPVPAAAQVKATREVPSVSETSQKSGEPVEGDAS